MTAKSAHRPRSPALGASGRHCVTFLSGTYESTPLTEKLLAPCSLLLAPCSLLLAPCSLLLAPCRATASDRALASQIGGRGEFRWGILAAIQRSGEDRYSGSPDCP
ncbi:MAG: hypothetical protein EXR77_07690 [Myxococcales bacterium]|nr:hypothetical protein [Myxococcales bacterium]